MVVLWGNCKYPQLQLVFLVVETTLQFFAIADHILPTSFCFFKHCISSITRRLLGRLLRLQATKYGAG